MKQNNKQATDWVNMIEHMTNAWKDAAKQWSSEQSDQADTISRQASEWMKSYKASLEDMDWKKMTLSMGQGPTLFSKFMDSMCYSHFKAYSDLCLETHKTCMEVMQPFHQLMMQPFRSIKHTFFPMMGFGGTSFPDSHEFMQMGNAYLKKMMRLQQLMKETSAKAVEDMTALIAEKERKEPLKDFTEFFNEWSAINEKAFAELFESEEFLSLKTGLEAIHKRFMELAENAMLMVPFPFVFKQQLDTIRHTDEELEKRISKLEERIAAQK